MTEIELVGALYEQMYKTLPKTDGKLMELESFIVRYYSHEGTLLLRSIAAKHSDGPIVLTQQPRHGMKPFVHPRKSNAVQVPVPTNVSAREVQAPTETQLGEGNPPLNTIKVRPGVAVDGGERIATEIAPMDLVTMRAKQLGLRYGADTIKAHLQKKGVSFPENASLTQLAQIAIHSA
jgi:hypothetical protein